MQTESSSSRERAFAHVAKPVTIDGTVNTDLAGCLGISTTTSTTLDVSLFDRCFQNYFWNYDNNGLKLLELRFYSAS